jgi:hypothetical protein
MTETDSPKPLSQQFSAEATPDSLAAEGITLYCANHPTVETSLRCSRCDKPICPKCAVRTPTGYKCKDCVRSQQKVFSTTRWYDYPLAFVLGAILGGLGSLLANALWIYLILLLAPAAGMVIAETVRLAVQKRRSLYLWQAMAAGIVVGCLPALALALLSLNFWSIVTQGFFLVVVTSTAVARLRGINIR